MSGVGIDLLDVGRFERALERRPRLADRLFTDAEREYAAGRARPAMHLAARFCAKEAVAKALGLTGWSFRDVEVVATGAAPEVRLSGTVAARAAELGGELAISLTHTDQIAGAVAIVRNGCGDCPFKLVSSLPDWLDPLYEAAEMRAADTWAIEEQGVPQDDLMARAALGLARVTAAVAGDGPIRIVAGKGNNGGDGRVAARLLAEDGREVEVIDGTEPFDPERLAGSGAVVDALLGTGFEGAPREPVASAIWAINRQDAPVVACDVPSGVNASTGEIETEAVRADATATFHGSKVGLHVNPGKEHAGRVEVAEIGIPRGAPGPAAAGLISERVLDLYPRRERSSSKFESGVVVVVGGSAGLTGAPTMAARSAQRAGAGYVQVAVPQPVQQAVDMRLLEQMSRGLPDDDGFHTPRGVPDVEEMAERAGAVVLGPGLGRAEGAQEFARGVAVAVEAPLLVDADGLNAHAGQLELFREREAPTVLTPHEAELGRLLGVEPDEVAAHRVEHVREAAERSGAVVLLKGDDTIVALPGGPLAISPGGTPALATAGTGDVLSGLIGALLAKRMDPFEAAALGALAHVLAARHAAELFGPDHVMAGDVVDALPHGLTLHC